MRILVAIPRSIAIGESVCRGLVAGILTGALTVAIAELFLPPLGRRTTARLLLRRACLGILRLGDGRGKTLAALNLAYKLAGALLACIRAFILALAAAPATALGLPHAMGYAVSCILGKVGLIDLATRLLGRRWRTLVLLHLGHILL
jgi:hypothetical protein